MPRRVLVDVVARDARQVERRAVVTETAGEVARWKRQARAHADVYRTELRDAPLDVGRRAGEATGRIFGAAQPQHRGPHDEVQVLEEPIAQLRSEFARARAAFARLLEAELELPMARALRPRVLGCKRMRGMRDERHAHGEQQQCTEDGGDAWHGPDDKASLAAPPGYLRGGRPLSRSGTRASARDRTPRPPRCDAPRRTWRGSGSRCGAQRRAAPESTGRRACRR